MGTCSEAHVDSDKIEYLLIKLNIVYYHSGRFLQFVKFSIPIQFLNWFCSTYDPILLMS